MIENAGRAFYKQGKPICAESALAYFELSNIHARPNNHSAGTQ
jgi:hypothetical protein